MQRILISDADYISNVVSLSHRCRRNVVKSAVKMTWRNRLCRDIWLFVLFNHCKDGINYKRHVVCRFLAVEIGINSAVKTTGLRSTDFISIRRNPKAWCSSLSAQPQASWVLPSEQSSSVSFRNCRREWIAANPSSCLSRSSRILP